MSSDPGKLRIAFTSEPFLGHNVHPDCVAGLNETVALLEELGHEVVEAAPSINREVFAISSMTIIAAEARGDVEWAAILAGRKPALNDFEPSTYALSLLGKSMRAVDYANAARSLQMATRDIDRFFEDYDMLLTPTLGKPPFQIGKLELSGAELVLSKIIGRLNASWLLQAVGLVEKLAAETFDFIPSTPLFNVTGQPAMSVPLHWNAAGLPIGMQFASRMGDEATLFRLAAQLERARPWKDRRLPILNP